ncbi:MAG: hypothetical protein JXB38_22045 [Anaerolineales bacterium]|nr:hypothetical protein [Anaerolineales bacterium]
MSYLVVLVLDNPDLCHNVLETWEATGVRGITILESTGVGRVRKAGLRDDIPLMPNLSELFKSSETHHRTLFSVVESAEQAESLKAATEKITGDLSQQNTGMMFVVELYKVFGASKA